MAYQRPLMGHNEISAAQYRRNVKSWGSRKIDEASPFFLVNLCQNQNKKICNEYYHEDDDILFIPMYFCQILIGKSAYYLII